MKQVSSVVTIKRKGEPSLTIYVKGKSESLCKVVDSKHHSLESVLRAYRKEKVSVDFIYSLREIKIED